MTERIPLVAIVGPTAVGKTRLAIDLATRFEGEIVSADSRQVYRHMDMGTAKPTPAERLQARHHLIDLVDPGEEFNVTFFQRLAAEAIGDIHLRGKLPLLVGGTGHYVWALLEGLQVPEVPPQKDLRRRLTALSQEAGGAERLLSQLRELDPVAASKIDARNTRRVIRAIEVSLATGVPFSQAGGRQAEIPYRSLIIGLTAPRELLYRRIDERVDAMFEAGWVDEVRSLLERGYSPTLPVFSSLGYQDIAEYLEGRTDLSTVIARVKLNTHRFARRQYAWFRLTDKRIQWLDITSDPLPAAIAAAERFLASTQLEPSP